MYFLTRHFKSFPVPPIIEDYSCIHGGYFQWPSTEVIAIDGKEYILPHGAIVWNPNDCESDVDLSNVLAHEYRHFLQFCLYGLWTVPNWEDTEALDHYWSNSPFERDAFSFSCALAPCDHYINVCVESSIPIMSRAQSLLLPTLSV